MKDWTDLSMVDIRIVCSGCKREYFLPVEMLEFKSILDVNCKSCNQLLELRHHSLKEQMVEEITGIIEKSTYAFINEPPVKFVHKKMEEEDETSKEDNMVN